MGDKPHIVLTRDVVDKAFLHGGLVQMLGHVATKRHKDKMRHTALQVWLYCPSLSYTSHTALQFKLYCPTLS